MFVRNTLLPVLSTAAVIANSALAQDERPTDTASLTIELNAASDNAGGCTLSFLIANGLDDDITQVVYETVIFDTDGQVERLTLLDFGALPAGRPRVRQFTLADTSCDQIGRVLVNGADTCEVEGLDEIICMERLDLKSRTDIEVLG